jgi:poly(hydroxyalkanoate) depolymerase family esterase
MHYAFSDGFPARGANPLQAKALTGPNPGGLVMHRYKPDGLAPGAPLLVILHGCGQTAAGINQGAGWSTLAQRFGFALLAPEQTMSNNMGTCFNWFQPGDTARGQGEAASIHQMIVETAKDFASDPARIFITGLSAGGGMTSAMLAAYPEMFAGGAIIAGVAHGAADNIGEAMSVMHRAPPRDGPEWGDAVRAASDHKGPWPRISVWHGGADRTVGISNQDAIVAQWRDVHGLQLKPLETRIGGARHLRWTDGRGVTKLESITVPGLGHGIPIKPGTDAQCCGEPAPFILDAGISSSFLIAEFFGLTKARLETKPKPAKLKVAAKAVVRAVLPLPISLEKPAAAQKSAVPIKQVIIKALTAAGLIKKP